MQRPEYQRALSEDSSTHRRIIARCEEVLIESCKVELRLAQQFCNLAEMHLHKGQLEHAQRLIEIAQKAVTAAGKYSRNPTQRHQELFILSQRIAELARKIRRVSL